MRSEVFNAGLFKSEPAPPNTISERWSRPMTNVGMPRGIYGMRLAAIIRDRWPPIKIIVASGYVDDPGDLIPAETVLFSKPYREERIIETTSSSPYLPAGIRSEYSTSRHPIFALSACSDNDVRSNPFAGKVKRSFIFSVETRPRQYSQALPHLLQRAFVGRPVQTPFVPTRLECAKLYEG